jgi:hypothetical protein
MLRLFENETLRRIFETDETGTYRKRQILEK